jgi:hypothetical protein
VEGLRAQKLLDFYSLDYPTKITPNPKDKKHPKFNPLLKKTLKNV